MMKRFYIRQVKEELKKEPLGDASRWWRSIYFHHIGKTAGTSYRRLFESLVNEDQVFPPYWMARHVLQSQLIQYRLFRGHFPFVFNQILPPPCAIVTTLREPRSHVISGYNHLNRLRGKHIAMAHRTTPMESFQDFLDDDVLVHMSTNTQTFSLGWDPPMAEVLQYSWRITDSSVNDISSSSVEALRFVHYGPLDFDRTAEDLFETALHRLIHQCVAFGVVGHEKASLNQMRSALGVPEALPDLPHDNRAVDQQGNDIVTWDSLTPQQRDRVDQMTAFDQQLYQKACAVLKQRSQHNEATDL